MEAYEHFKEAKVLMKKAETARAPERLIGLAHGHFMAAQTIIQVATFDHEYGLDNTERRSWEAAVDMEFDPSGKPVTK
jgi:hypothetical protein